MLSHVDAIATVATRDLARAREFYTNVLGLEEEDAGADCPGVLTYRSGNSRIFVYQSEYAGTNQATALNWDVGVEIRPVVGTPERMVAASPSALKPLMATEPCAMA